MPRRKFTMVVIAVIAAAAGLAWWLRPQPPTASVATNVAIDPRPAATEIPVAPAEARAGVAPARRHAASASVATVNTPNDGPSAATPGRVRDYERGMVERQFNGLYEDLGAALGTSQYETSQLIGMLVDHYIQLREIPGHANRMIALEQVRELRREQREDLVALLGESRLTALDKYEESMGARREVQELSFFLGASTPLTENQRRRLVRAAIDAHVYYQEPQYTGVESMSVLEQERLAKMQQRDVNMQEISRGILSAEQMSALTEYQQNRRNVMEDVLRKQQD
jgi:hypothetical protein